MAGFALLGLVALTVEYSESVSLEQRRERVEPTTVVFKYASTCIYITYIY